MLKDIKFAIAGFGQIGKKHAKLIANCENAELTAVIENNPDSIPSDFTIPVYKSIHDFVLNGGVADVISVCTPNHLHAENSREAIEAGFHVLCEKPMGLKKADCEDVIKLSLKKGKSVFVVMQNRYSNSAEWLRKICDEGALGKIFMVQTNCYWNRDERYYNGSSWKGKAEMDGGVLFTQFSHFVDMLYWCFGEMTDFASNFHNFSHQHLTDFEDTGTINFKFKSGGMGVLNFSTSVWDKNFESSITVIGEKGSLKIGGQYMEKLEYFHVKGYEKPELGIKSLTNKYGEFTGNEAHHLLSVQNVVETLTGKSTISTNAMEGMKVVEMIEMMYKSSNTR